MQTRDYRWRARTWRLHQQCRHVRMRPGTCRCRVAEPGLGSRGVARPEHVSRRPLQLLDGVELYVHRLRPRASLPLDAVAELPSAAVRTDHPPTSPTVSCRCVIEMTLPLSLQRSSSSSSSSLALTSSPSSLASLTHRATFEKKKRRVRAQTYVLTMSGHHCGCGCGCGCCCRKRACT